MIPSAGSGRRRPRLASLAGLALASVLLTGCTSSFLADSGPEVAPEPSVTATPEPTASTPPPEPEPEYDCDDIVLNRPGNYVLGECGTVTLEGTGIDLTFTSIATLVLRGDRADLLGGQLGSVELQGQGNDISVESVRSLRIRGEGNTVLANGAIGSVVVDGNENVVTSGEGIDSVIDNGLLNEIG
jgi:hypothetical protein